MHTCHDTSADLPCAKFPSYHIQRIKTKQQTQIDKHNKLGNGLSSFLAIFDETVPGHGCEVSVDDTPGKLAVNVNVINAQKQKIYINSFWHSDVIW